ncbi:MAG: MarC family protein [Bacteroidetes bacterium]|nr:MAG: MarC family protein [Bacteroidota bacterium]
MKVSELLFFIPIAFTALFPVVNPIGTAILFLNLTEEANSKIRRQIARKIAANSILVMIITLFIGIYFLKLFGISIPVVQTCGGLVLFAMGWKSLNSEESLNDASKKAYIKDDVEVTDTYAKQSFYPFTFPLTIGPGTIATTLTLGAEASKESNSEFMLESYLGAAIAMLLISLCIFIAYGYADRLVMRLSPNFQKAMMRLLSFILLCIGGQITANGIHALIMTF